MPSRFTFTYKTYIEIGCYIALLFFLVPIQIENDYQTRGQFFNYLRDFNKSYPEEDIFNLRFTAFKKSLDTINLLNINRTNTSAQYGLTKFSDRSPEEFMSFQNNRPKVNITNLKEDSNKLIKHIFKRSVYWQNIPLKVDWRDKHVVSKVKHQRSCGACWAFAVTQTIESMQAIKTKNLTELSIQQMIDCSVYNNGCHGGDTCSLLRWIHDYSVTIVNESYYPLTLENQECKNTNSINGVGVDGYICDSFVGREDIILKLLATNGPVAVGISGETWQNYIGGVIQFHCDGELSHAVQIVGYDLTAAVPFYIVRNSWGEDFGDNGYLYVAIGGNVCGVAYEVAAVTLF